MGRTRRSWLVVASAILLLSAASVLGKPPRRELVATCGAGYLERVNGHRVLHLKGSPEEMGRQHGTLLKPLVRENVEFFVSEKSKTRLLMGKALVARFDGRVPPRFVREMKALAKATDLPYWRVAACNLIPEMFHCTGFVLLRQATDQKKLYHGRVLDYGVGLGLQERAVLIIQEPEGREAFVSVSYAGFIGSVTGMNLSQIAIGQLGGDRNAGKWEGVPMSFLVRMVLEDADSLEEAVAVFRDNPRTCEYYYVISDAEADDAVAIHAVPERIRTLRPGQKHDGLPQHVDKAILVSAGGRYRELVKRVRAGYGEFTVESAIRLMDAPVAMKHNLHDVLMVPEDAVLYVAHAAADGSPAWKQTYQRFDVRDLMKGTRGSERAASAN